MPPPVVCPHCRLSDQVEKVSTLYIMGLDKSKAGGGIPITTPGEDIPAPLWQRREVLSRRLKPPAMPKELPTRPLHPDLVVLVFSLILPIFLYGIFTSQNTLFYPALAMLGASYVFYFTLRKKIIARFETQKRKREQAEQRTRTAIERWMGLYYCGRDDGVFESNAKKLIPADEMTGYLLQG